MKTLRVAAAAFIALSLAGCAGKVLRMEKNETKNDEFDKAVSIVVPGSETAKPVEPAAPATKPSKGKAPAKVVKAKPPKKVRGKKEASAAPAGPPVHEPDIEDGTGFVGRRPVVDPFHVGEKVIHDVHYFKISAGSLTLKVDPFVEVNGHKAYDFVTQLETYPKFSRMVYAVDDKVVTMVDFDQLIPRVFTLEVHESSQARDAKSFFDFDKNQARYWEKKVSEKNGTEEKRQQWEILPYSQNVFSAIFYMRTFAWETGKEYAFRVADDEKNIVFKGKALERETLETEIGDRKAIKIKAEIVSRGVLAQTGDITIWLSDDDRKIPLRIESQIKIGTLVSEITSYEPGAP